MMLVGVGLVISDRASRWFRCLIRKPYGLIFDSPLGLGLVGIVFGAGCFLLKQRTHFMGDGYLLLDWLRGHIAQRPEDVFSYQLKIWLYAWLKPLGATPEEIFQGVSVFAGVSGLVGVIVLLKFLGISRWRRMLFLHFYLSSGLVLLFLGHVENYSLLYLFTVWFLLAGVGFARGELGIWPVAGFLCLALLMHVSAVVAIPSFVALFWNNRHERSWPALGLLMLTLLLVLNYAAVFSWGLPGASLSGWPLWFWVALKEGANHFSFPSLGTFVNVSLIVGPVAFVTTVGDIAARLKKPQTILADPTQRFLAIYLASFLLYNLVLEPKLGAARDWDLLSIPGVALIAWASLVVRWSKRSLSLGLAVSWLVLFSWLAVSVGTTIPEQRLQSICKGFPVYAKGYAYETLGTYYRNCGRLTDSVNAYQDAVKAVPGHGRFHGLLGTAYVSLYNESKLNGVPSATFMQDAEDCLRTADRLRPNYSFVLKNLGLLLVRKGDLAEAERLLLRLQRQRKMDFIELRALGYCQLKLGEYEESILTLTEALKLRNASEVRAFLTMARKRIASDPD